MNILMDMPVSFVMIINNNTNSSIESIARALDYYAIEICKIVSVESLPYNIICRQHKIVLDWSLFEAKLVIIYTIILLYYTCIYYIIIDRINVPENIWEQA